MPVDHAALILAATTDLVRWREHARSRAEERGIARDVVHAILATGEIIEWYPTSGFCPAVLVLGFAAARPIHVVAAMDPIGGIAYIITVYEPTADKFETDWKTRRRP